MSNNAMPYIGKPMKIGRRFIHFTEGQAQSLRLVSKPGRGMQKYLMLYANGKGEFCRVRGKRVPVGRLPMSSHYHAEGDLEK